MDTIKKLWIVDDRIWIATDNGEELSRPLEAFPTLKFGTPKQQANFELLNNGEYVYWPDVDEYIHVSSFREIKEPDYNNEIALLFKRFPQLNPMSVAESMGVHFSLLYKFIYGIISPSKRCRDELNHTLHTLGAQLMEVQV